MKLLLDEMYSTTLALALRTEGIDATTVAERGLAGSSDSELFAISVSDGYAILTENVADFARISADHGAAGRHHPGVLIALSTRFSRRPDGTKSLVNAVKSAANEDVRDRIVYLDVSRQA